MRFIVPAGMEHFPIESGYAPAVAEGGFLFLAGQLGRDDQRNVIVDPQTQFTRAWENVVTILTAAGAGVGDLVDVTTFHVGLREHLALYKTVRDRFLQGHTPPWTAIGVSELSRLGLLVEIKCIARLPG
ncbi:MAG: RidA family protein [Rubritepida sp.]|nr:RidA family protein [Rubritepida sp.]